MNQALTTRTSLSLIEIKTLRGILLSGGRIVRIPRPSHVSACTPCRPEIDHVLRLSLVNDFMSLKLWDTAYEVLLNESFDSLSLPPPLELWLHLTYQQD